MSQKINDELKDNLLDWLEENEATVDDIKSDEKGKYIMDFTETEMNEEGYMEGVESKKYLPDNFQDLI